MFGNNNNKQGPLASYSLGDKATSLTTAAATRAAATLLSGLWATWPHHQQQQWLEEPLLSSLGSGDKATSSTAAAATRAAALGIERGKRAEEGGVHVRWQPPMMRYVHLKSPHHPTYLTNYTRTSIDVRAAFMRLPGAGGDIHTRGYHRYHRF